MSEHIKPCPFCGSDEVNVNRTNDDACWIGCANEACGAETGCEAKRADAIEIWNTRTSVFEGAEARIAWDMDREHAERKNGAKPR